MCASVQGVLVGYQEVIPAKGGQGLVCQRVYITVTGGKGYILQ